MPSFKLFRNSGETGQKTQVGGVIKASSDRAAGPKLSKARGAAKQSAALTRPGHSDWWTVEQIR